MATSATIGSENAVLRVEGSDAALADRLLAPLWAKSKLWWLAFGLTALGTFVFGAATLYTMVAGIGVWGNNIPVAWAFAITNFVWWVGIGHAGTFISAFLLLLQQEWRASVNRLAEAMTLFALVQAGIFPVLHLGRPWFAYWLIPYPATMGVWPQFRSALPWDFAAILTYFTVSLLFWYMGLVPDLAIARDRAPTGLRRSIYGVFALGWRGAARHWEQYRIAYGLLAGLATPLVISVHSIVSMDFAIAQLPGWHSTIFPPYFVAGALYSGFAMVITLMIPVRSIFKLRDVITRQHLDSAAKMMLAMGWMLIFSYVIEFFLAWYRGDVFGRHLEFVTLPGGPFAWLFWLMIACNCLTPQLLWFRSVRTSPLVLFGAALVIQVGMWSERFLIVAGSLTNDFLPSSWATYDPTWVDWSLLGGSISFFLLLFLLFLRFVPFIPISDVLRLRHDLARREG